ncbi:hypothetical protein [Erythrobacter sp. THAF29]|uniref:hypothetical protein n=1 Tax=Erythrobacter sp. THAF29 TaxID=2587851 RepID=UPI001268A406|nr:hypothetical protein [Erythrobacter sp. THAF29]QFT77063.1 hypothetical protein FIU90_05870 [Erythrobacter sp. THAF29]
MMTRTQMRSLGWMAVLAICVGLFVVLSIRVHAVKSEVLLAERKIVSLQKQNKLLETEFETRASQRQLANWNAVEFGFEAPRADQYLEGERQLASLGQPLGPDAPSPIRIARADVASSESSGDAPREMVSPITGEAITLASAAADSDAGTVFADAFGDFLIEASPIRAANAQTAASDAASSFAAEASGGRE